MSQPAGPSDDDTRILRRVPSQHRSGPLPAADALPAQDPLPAADALDAPKTSLIRRQPTGALPTAADAEPATSMIEGASDADLKTGYIPRARPVTIPRGPATANPRTAALAATVSILSGWATAVIATDLIAGWWRTDQLFCVAIGFLAAISAAATIGGVIALLLRRRMGPLLSVVGAVIGVLIFGSLFLAGAKVHPVVYAMPVLPVAGIVLTLLPSTRRWATRRQGVRHS